MSWVWAWAFRSMTLEPLVDVARRRRLPERRICDQPRIAFSGVRSSWLERGEELVLHAAGRLGLGPGGLGRGEQASRSSSACFRWVMSCTTL